MSIDHEPSFERSSIEKRGGLCTTCELGDVPRVNGQLAVSRAFGDEKMKNHLRSDPDIRFANIDCDNELLILTSDELSNQEDVDIAIKFKDPLKARQQFAAWVIHLVLWPGSRGNVRTKNTKFTKLVFRLYNCGTDAA